MSSQPPPSVRDATRRWSIRDAIETYCIDGWGEPFFSINPKGHLVVKNGEHRLDLKQLVDDLVDRGLELPLLLRFTDLLGSRIEQLNTSFAQSIEDHGYEGRYQGVYPIKVNQTQRVVQEILHFGRRYNFGLEAGSKPELLASIAMLDDPEALIICNGYKDASYVETALLASQLNRKIVVVIEKPGEAAIVRRASEKLGITPTLGVRMKLSTRGAGKWESSGGDTAKFGLSAAELVELVQNLKSWGMHDSLNLLHFHLGSQITSIRAIKNALREAARMYTELTKLKCPLQYIDVGGGLAVDYDGSQTNFDSSMNYDIGEYTNDVVSTIQEVCDEAHVPHPTIVSESGRAIVAHHAAIVTNVIGVTGIPNEHEPQPPEDDDHNLIHNLWEIHTTLTRKNVLECLHDALEYRDQALQLFNHGSLSLQDRARCERLFWTACTRMAKIGRDLKRPLEELETVNKSLDKTYFCNLSIFQSLPDAWAIEQLFPILPIHRLDERPTERGVLADITCDSDGSIATFIGRRDVKNSLELHKVEGEPYYLGIMLTGAYQEILGDLHNLFGDTHAVHVRIDEGGYTVAEVIQGDSIADVLGYVGYRPSELLQRVHKRIQQAAQSKHIRPEQARQLIQRYREGLSGYTYLE